MNEQHLEECLKRLADARRLLDQIQTDLVGAQEFRDAVYDLLEGTPFGARADSAYDGLYGRLRAAVNGETPPASDMPTTRLRHFEVWREGWCTNGDPGVAQKLGEADAMNFTDACEIVVKRCGRWDDYSHRHGFPAVWSCQLFDNEKEARARYG